MRSICQSHHWPGSYQRFVIYQLWTASPFSLFYAVQFGNMYFVQYENMFFLTGYYKYFVSHIRSNDLFMCVIAVLSPYDVWSSGVIFHSVKITCPFTFYNFPFFTRTYVLFAYKSTNRSLLSTVTLYILFDFYYMRWPLGVEWALSYGYFSVLTAVAKQTLLGIYCVGIALPTNNLRMDFTELLTKPYLYQQIEHLLSVSLFHIFIMTLLPLSMICVRNHLLYPVHLIHDYFSFTKAGCPYSLSSPLPLRRLNEG